MAPEMLNGKKYDEKVDVFSFGIILCEIISRVQADPDYIPRNHDFSLNCQQFKESFCHSEEDPCPEIFYTIAFLCCDLNPDKRPSFKLLSEWLDRISVHCAIVKNIQHLPIDLSCQIHYFRGEESISNTPEMNTQTEKEIFSEELQELKKATTSSEISDTLQILRNVSPHLAKDFNDNGDRIRDSLKARRKQKIREKRHKIQIENGVMIEHTRNFTSSD